MHAFRTGQWVRFKSPVAVPGAHVVGGYTVGIFQRASEASVVVQAVAKKTGQPPPAAVAQLLPAHIVVVDEAGFNLPRIERGEHKGNWTFLPSQVTDLQPVLDRSHIPAERLKHTDPKWQPKA